VNWELPGMLDATDLVVNYFAPGISSPLCRRNGIPLFETPD
jgi:hypothetical protein